MTAVANDWTRRRWRRLLALGALALTVAAGTLAATAGAALGGPAFGVAEDASKYADDGGHRVYGDLRDLGMSVDRWTARFTGDPGVIAEQAFLDRAAPVAQERGVRIVLSLLQERAAAPDPGAFCAWAETVARRYPTIREIVIGNEVNATRFWAPQHTEADVDAGPRSYFTVLSTCYDRLKAVDPGIRVIGMGLSPRAVDRNSTKPLAFLRTVGTIYRASGRTTPIMDALAIHPYPNPNASPPPPPARAAYDDPDFFGLAQLDRVKLAVHDAFAGTAQPTTAEGLKLVVDEFGYQSDTSTSGAYTGDESSPVVTDDVQASYYRDAIAMTACDPDVSDVLLFHLIDETTRSAGPESGGWQSGLVRPSGERKPAYEAVRAAIAAGCTGAPVTWSPPTETGVTTTSRTASAAEALERALESLPELSTDGVGSFLLGTAVGSVATELTAEVSDFVARLQTPGTISGVMTLPFILPDGLYMSFVVFVIPFPCIEGGCTIPSGDVVTRVLRGIRIISTKKSGSVELCPGQDCGDRLIQAARAPRTKVLVAASGKARVAAGGHARIPLRIRRRGPGVYLPVLAVRSVAKPSRMALVRLRPVVVKPVAKKTGTTKVAQVSSPPAQR